MKKKRRVILSLVAALICAITMISPLSVQAAYNTEDWDTAEGMVLVDNNAKHDSGAHIRLFLICPNGFMEGWFNYEFLTHDSNLYPDGWDCCYLAYQTRAENLKLFETHDDYSIYYVEFCVEPGSYVFSRTLNGDYYTLTPDFSSPINEYQNIYSEDVEGYEEYPHIIGKGTTYLYCVSNPNESGLETFAVDHMDELIAFAVDIDTKHQEMTAEKEELSDLLNQSELISQSGIDTDALLDDLADTLESEDLENTSSTESPVVSTAEDITVPEPENTPHKLSIKDIIILLVFFGGFIAAIVFKKKKKDE